MALSPELATFCRNWLTKAEAYSSEEIGGAFDQFFRLYVAFNRLYAEATFRLARRGQVRLRDSISAVETCPGVSPPVLLGQKR
jgi:hypothetical protein